MVRHAPARGRHERDRKRSPGADPQLAVGVREVGLDRPVLTATCPGASASAWDPLERTDLRRVLTLARDARPTATWTGP